MLKRLSLMTMKWLPLLILLAGCTGHVIMSPMTPADLDNGKDIDGVLVTGPGDRS
jgi:hypothetical protein